MNSKITSKLNSLISLGIIMMLLVLVLFSSFYISAERIHECHHEDCPICSCIEHCENILNQVGTALIIIVVAAWAYSVLSVSIHTHSTPLFNATPVSRKIRLNN